MVKSLFAYCKFFAIASTLTLMGGSASALTLSMDTVSGDPGDTVTVTVRAYDFADIIAMQGTVQFDSTVADFLIPMQPPYGLPGLGASNFGTLNTGSGKLTFSWDCHRRLRWRQALSQY